MISRSASTYPLPTAMIERVGSAGSRAGSAGSGVGSRVGSDEWRGASVSSAALRAALEAARAAAEAWAVVVAKDRVARREVALGFDPADHSPDDYDAVADYLAPLAAEAAVAPMTAAGLRWTYRGPAVLFEMRRLLNAPFDEVVARVDVSAAIRTMSDYIGGASAVVSRDGSGRVTRQAERNLYLPQPNWIALSGGRFIDVCKLEVVHYGDDEHRIAWRTISSPNGSAVFDDGTVILTRYGAAQTEVTVAGLQQFTLPPFWAALEPYLVPAVKDALVEESYRRFFATTLDNIEAVYEGRDHRIGRDRTAADDEPPEQRLGDALRAARALLPAHPVADALRWWQRQTAPPEPDDVDEHGFRHFAGHPAREA